MDRIKLNGSKFSISRDRDGAGDSGPMLEAINPETLEVTTGEVVIGCSMRCGTYWARTFGNDWWLTTPVTEILEVNEEKTEVKVKTGNSTYTVRAF